MSGIFVEGIFADGIFAEGIFVERNFRRTEICRTPVSRDYYTSLHRRHDTFEQKCTSESNLWQLEDRYKDREWGHDDGYYIHSGFFTTKQFTIRVS